MHNLEMIVSTFGLEDDRVVATQMILGNVPNRKTTCAVTFDDSSDSVVVSMLGKRHTAIAVVGKKGRINWEVSRKHEPVRTGSECQISNFYKLIGVD